MTERSQTNGVQADNAQSLNLSLYVLNHQSYSRQRFFRAHGMPRCERQDELRPIQRHVLFWQFASHVAACKRGLQYREAAVDPVRNFSWDAGGFRLSECNAGHALGRSRRLG